MDSFISSSWSWCTQCNKSFPSKRFVHHVKTVHQQSEKSSRKKSEEPSSVHNQIDKTSPVTTKKRKSDVASEMDRNIKVSGVDEINKNIESILKSPSSKKYEESIPKKRKIGPASKTGRAKFKVFDNEKATIEDEDINKVESEASNDDDFEESDSDHGIPKTMPQSSEEDSENSDDDFSLPFKLPLHDNDDDGLDGEVPFLSQTKASDITFHKYLKNSSDDIVKDDETAFKKRRPGPASKTGRMPINKKEHAGKIMSVPTFENGGRDKVKNIVQNEGTDSDDPDGDLEENDMEAESDEEDPGGDLSKNNVDANFDNEDPDGDLKENDKGEESDNEDPDGDLEEDSISEESFGEETRGDFEKSMAVNKDLDRYLENLKKSMAANSDNEDPDGDLEDNDMDPDEDLEEGDIYPDEDLEENYGAGDRDSDGDLQGSKIVAENLNKIMERYNDDGVPHEELEDGEVFNKDGDDLNDTSAKGDQTNDSDDDMFQKLYNSFDSNEDKDNGKEIDKVETGKDPDSIENKHSNGGGENTSNNKIDKINEILKKADKASDQTVTDKSKAKFRIPKKDIIIKKPSPKKSKKSNQFLNQPNQFGNIAGINDQFQSTLMLSQLMQSGQIPDNSNPMFYQMDQILNNQPAYVDPNQMFNNQIAYIDQNQIFNSPIDQDQIFNNQIADISQANPIFDTSNQLIDPAMQIYGGQNQLFGMPNQVLSHQSFDQMGQTFNDQSLDQTGLIYNDPSLDQSGQLFNDQSLNDALEDLTAQELQNLNDAISQQPDFPKSNQTPDFPLSNQTPINDSSSDTTKQQDQSIVQADPSNNVPSPDSMTKKPKVNKAASNGPPKRSAPNKWTLAPGDVDESTIKISNSMDDVCRTYCKLCNEAIKLVNMRNHTKAKHKMNITEYKTQFGTEYELIEKVYHKCGICSAIIILDSDSVATHLKTPGHKTKDPKGTTHKQYNEQYMVYAKKPKTKE